MDGPFDVAIIGGGINGAGIAADAAARGLRVVLLDQGDLGGATSSASSKLIHGGLRYLEHYDFRLVREALAEREVLLAKAPHLIWPLRFVLPHAEGMRPRLLIRAGLFLYDHLATRQKIGASRAVDLATEPAGRALRSEFQSGFTYWDCWADDARLVIANCQAARQAGASIRPRTRVTRFEPADGSWRLSTLGPNGTAGAIEARVLVNAAGPWAGRVQDLEPRNTTAATPVRLVKGSHIVVPRIEGCSDGLLLQNTDRRVVFVLPFEDQFSLIGTTDVPFDGDPASATCSADETTYLLAAANRFLRQSLDAHDVVWTFSGVRPLNDDGQDNASAVSRDYKLQFDHGGARPPMLTVLGGKLTTYRRLSESAVDLIAPVFPHSKAGSTATSVLPGGDFGPGGIDRFRLDAAQRLPWLAPTVLARLIRTYGTAVTAMIGDARSLADLGEDFGGGLSEREALYLRDHEWASSAEDILWRRTKTGLRLTQEERSAVSARLQRMGLSER